MESKSYYCVVTRRFHLRCKHREWLENTQKLYNEIILYYYDLFLEQEDSGRSLSALNNRQILRELEILTVPGRDKKPVSYPLPWDKIPLYFRRSAINAAVAAARGSLNHHRKRTEAFRCAVTFYKGSYRSLTEQEVTLKVWDGLQWKWMHCRLNGNTFSAEDQNLSPSVTLEYQNIFLDIPVRQIVPDGRKAKERFDQGCKICSIQFGSVDLFAVGVIMDEKGQQLDLKFFKGAKEYAHRCQLILKKIEESELALGIEKEVQKGHVYNRKYWMKLKNLNNYYSNSISRQVINYCVENLVSVIVMPDYSKDFSKYVVLASGNWSGIHLGGRIREQIFYKAWQSGILVLEVSPHGCGSTCAVCGAPIQKDKCNFRCRNAHQGNRYLNSARNIGIKCIKSFERNK